MQNLIALHHFILITKERWENMTFKALPKLFSNKLGLQHYYVLRNAVPSVKDVRE